MSTFAVVAHRVTPTNTRLGAVLTPGQALARLGPGDIALGRLDVLPSLDGVEPGLWALDRLAASGVTVLNGRRTLVAAHDKLATADSLVRGRRAASAHGARRAVARTAGARAAARPEAPLRLVGHRRVSLRRRRVDLGHAARAAHAPLVRSDRRDRTEARGAARLRPARRGRRRAESWERSGGSPHRASGARMSRSAPGASPSRRRRRRARSRSRPPRRSTARSSASTCCPPTSAPGSCSR